MQDFYRTDYETLLKDAKYCVKEKKIYQIEPADNIFNSEIIQKLGYFYNMCGDDHFNHCIGSVDPVRIRFSQIKQMYRYATLPYHSAVAFFQKLMDLKEMLPQNIAYFMLRHFLPYALPCRGLVFGSGCYTEGAHYIHPCDLKYIDLPFSNPEETFKDVLGSLADLRICRSFQEESVFYLKTISNLSCQKEFIEDWVKSAKIEKADKSESVDNYPKPWEGDIDKQEQMFFDFYELYSTYCTSQVSEKDLYRLKQVKVDLDKLKEIAQVIFKMERLLKQLESIKEIEDRNRNILAKKRWLRDLREVLSASDMKSGITALKETMSKQQEFPDLYKLIVSQNVLSANRLKNYPILDEEAPVYKLGKKEGKELRWHRKSGVARIIDWLSRGAKNKSIRKAMPFYLLDLFANDLKPLRPFKRSPYYFHPEKLKFQGKISFCTHPNVVRKQESHYYFYQSLFAWCNRYFEKEWDRSLCNALYTFYRCHLVLLPPSAETNFLGNDFSILKQAIYQVFDAPPAMFPQRMGMEISINEFYDFFFNNADSEVRTVRKALLTLVTEADTSEYKKLAFLDDHGLGYSFHPDEWFCKIEEWLSEVIRRDETVLKYVETTNADAALHQTQVDLAIQFICCQIIQKSMTQEVLIFCKQIFSPNCQ